MSLLSQQSQVNVDTAFFAPASGGGGGGGGGGPNLTLSSIVMNSLSAAPFGTGAISWAYDFPNNSAAMPAGQVGLQQGLVKDSAGNDTNAVVAAINASGSAQTADFAASRILVGTQGTGSLNAAVPTLFNVSGLLSIAPGASISSLTVSSINGAVPGGSISADLSVSSLAAANTVSTLCLNLQDINSLGSYPFRLRSNSGGVLLETAGGDGGSLSLSSITVSSITADTTSLNALSWQSATNCGSLTMNGSAVLSGAGTIQGAGVECTSSFSGPYAAISSIQNINPSGTVNLKSVGIPRNSGVTPFNMIQAGYVSGLPYGSTVLFQYPYPDDNSLPAVMLTATNANTSGGSNPNLSLNTTYGTEGVSSIGFAVDARNAGVGYTSDFFWMAVPQTQ
jgi:hypothetical protein